ncbi:MAG: cytochrome c oxidase, cbb3-type, CcoQ subunit [Campylobacterales bacterium]
MDINTFSAYGYFFFTVFLVVVLYSYIYHLYNSEKKGTRNYEKYGDMALNDEITDKPVESVSEDETKKEEA